jgi:hypothetical protein
VSEEVLWQVKSVLCVCEEVFVKRGEYYICLKKFVTCEECIMCVCVKFLLTEESITCV